MKYYLIYLVFSLTLIKVNLLLREEERQQLLNKLAKKVSLDEDFPEYQEDFNDDFKKMKYNVSEIQAHQKTYGLPENYNFFKDTGAEIIVKNQNSCGACWAFAASSALAYRYKKLGIDINLSPQHALSCYFPNCVTGNFGIDAQMNLVKNGTVTESCFPYASADGKTIPECPNKCVDGSEFKKYYSQNAYNAYNTNQAHFNNLVILTMDQLVNYGPVRTGFDIYKDFYDFSNNKSKCLNDIYTYDGTSAKSGAHSVIIVGYGLLKNKFYWLIQNSWGAEWCDNGLIKMEIGQFNGISFSEPYIPPQQVTPVEIDVNFLNSLDNCNLLVNTKSSLDDWNNTLDVQFTHEDGTSNIFIQIGKNKILGKNKITSNFEVFKPYHLIKGKYIYNGFKSLGVENTFKLNDFQGKSLQLYGHDDILPLINKDYYISKIGSKIVFKHVYGANDDTLPPIYKISNYNYRMNKCYKIKTSTKLDDEMGYCEITKEDLSFIESMPKVTICKMIECGSFSSTDIILYKLNTEMYPVFEVFKFLNPIDKNLTKESELIIVSNISGSLKYFQNEESYFYCIMEIEYNNKNKTVLAYCGANVNYENVESNLTCRLKINDEVYQYDNLYLLPYSYLDKIKIPFEVIITKTIKAGDNPEPEPTDPQPTDPEPTDPEPTDPQPTDPEPTDTGKPTPSPTKSSYLGNSMNLFISLKLLLLLI